MAATGEPRYVYANAGRALNEGFAENRSDSAKYSLVSFVPLFLLENLTRFANAFFLVVGLMQMLPAITVTGGYPSQLAPLAFVLLFDAVITVVEDASRHGDDFRANNRQVLVARPRPDPTAAAPLGPSRRGAARSHATAAATAAAGGRAAGSETAAASSSGRASAGGFESIPWQAVRVGDVIRLRRGEVAPADCVLLGSRTATGAVAPDACYVQTAQLDGETNLKVRRAPALPKGIRVRSDRSALRFRGAVLCDPPSASFSAFNGVMEPRPTFPAKRAGRFGGRAPGGADDAGPGSARKRAGRRQRRRANLPSSSLAKPAEGHYQQLRLDDGPTQTGAATSVHGPARAGGSAAIPGRSLVRGARPASGGRLLEAVGEAAHQGGSGPGTAAPAGGGGRAGAGGAQEVAEVVEEEDDEDDDGSDAEFDPSEFDDGCCDSCARDCNRTDWRGWCTVLCGAWAARWSIACFSYAGRALGCRPARRLPSQRWHVPSPSDPASVALDASCLILRGAEVRSVDVAWALVVYTGSDSKVRVAQSQGAFKRPTSEGYLNRAIGVLALLLVAVCVATTFAWVVWASDSDDGTFRTSVLRDETATPDVLGAVTMAGTQFLLQAGLIPVSLYVSVRLVRTVSALLLARDRSLLPGSAQRMAEHIASASDAPGDAGGCCCCGCFARCGLTDNVNSALAEFSGGVPQHVRVRTMDLLDELGQITHVFSDKTGTLTRNSMVLRQLWAGGAQYGLSAAPAAGAGGCTAGGGANAGAPGAGSGAQTAAGLLADAVAGSSDGVPMPPAYPWEGSDSEDDSAEPGARHARSAASGVMIPFSAASGGSAGGAGEGPSRGPAGTRHARGASDSYAPLDGGLPSPSASASPGAGLAAASKAETSGAAPAWTPPAIGAEVRGPNVRFVDGSTSHPGRFLATDSAAAADLILHTDVSAEVATAGAPAARRAAGGDGGADAAAAGQQGAPAASGHEDDGEQAAAAVRRLLINMAINHSVIIEPSESGQNQPRPGQTAPERGRRETVGSDSGAMTGTIGQSRSASFAGRPARARTGSSAGGLLPGGGASRGSSGGWSGYTLSASSPDEAAFVQAAARLGVTFLARKGQWTAVEQVGPRAGAGSSWLALAAARAEAVLGMQRPVEIEEDDAGGAAGTKAAASSGARPGAAQPGVTVLASCEGGRVRAVSRGAHWPALAGEAARRLWSRVELWRVEHTLPYDQRRKRMSVVVRGPFLSGRAGEGGGAPSTARGARGAGGAGPAAGPPRFHVLCKGADSVVLPRLRDAATSADGGVDGDRGPQQRHAHRMRRHRDRLQGQLKRWGGTGLRTLCFAGRAMEDGEAADWSKRFAAAWSDLDAQRKRRAGDETGVLGKLAAEAERDLSLHGATAVEDQLQLGVPETLALLARAGVAVSVITGDKADTAVNIAYSSRLLDQHTDVIAATAVLLAALSAADASIVCRARPDQKAAVVRLVREGEPAAVTLAIGDGANDVDMLKAAHVGVGISGAEGSQAANASDFAVARFRMLAPLMLVHGRWFVRRLAAMVLYLLYKNVVYGAALLAFGALSAWSGQRLFVVSVDLAYNVVFTGLPVLVTALFDRDIPAELAVALPSLFTEGRGAPQLGASAFAWWLITGALEGVLVLVVPWLTIGQSVRLVELPSLFAGLADSPPGEAALGHGGGSLPSRLLPHLCRRCR
ncbi:hypothetical protein FNF31_03078 [Cafeteria roenbergensis]|uniref:Uncharacterized protein n=1 Tax=Cafeteria roenbergensis TaxID=33653 RepID=A0A5A8DDV2_CAFRO|nr:hypothetical protein FNF31_03078 [Cafeteria roenbergensis]